MLKVEVKRAQDDFRPVVLVVEINSAADLAVMRNGFKELVKGNTTPSEFDELCEPIQEILDNL